MSHLTDEQLGARLDGALTGAALEAADRHLADCAECRERLAELTGLDASLSRALDHDPGEAYFASFADRVSQRIAAGPAAAVATPAPGWLDFLRSPRRLAWAGSAAALVLVGAIALIMARGHGPEELAQGVAPRSELGAARDAGRAADERSAARSLDAAPPASLPPAEGAAPPGRRAKQEASTRPTDALAKALQRAGSPQAPAHDLANEPQKTSEITIQQMQQQAPAAKERDKLKAQASPPPAASPAPAPPAAAAGNVVEVRTLPNGEQVVTGAGERRLLQPAPAPDAKGALRKPGVTPMRQGLADGAPESAAASRFGAFGGALQDRAVKMNESFRSDADGALEVPLRALPTGGNAVLGSARDVATAASRGAARSRTLAAWGAAAMAWGEVDSLSERNLEVARDARLHVAEACMNAWRIDPTAARQALADSRVNACLADRPAAAVRELLLRWRRELGF